MDIIYIDFYHNNKNTKLKSTEGCVGTLSKMLSVTSWMVASTKSMVLLCMEC